MNKIYGRCNGDFGNTDQVSDTNIVGQSPDGKVLEAKVDNGTLIIEETKVDTSKIFKEKLKFGDVNDDVLNLQTKLNEIRYYDAELDGVFGFETLKAVKSFQKAQGIEPNGQVNAETFNRLFNPPEGVKIMNVETEKKVQKTKNNRALVGGAAALVAGYFLLKE